MFKKTLITAAVLSSFASVAMADVTVYGRLDTSLYYQNVEKTVDGVTKTDADKFSMDSGAKSGSRLGFKGQEDLGNGYKVGFVLEHGLNSETGEPADEDKFFNRDAYVEVAGPFGTVQFGRTGALSSGANGGIIMGKASPFGTTYKEIKSTNIFYGAATRIDNMVRYESPKMAGARLYAQYSNGVEGDDSVDDSARDRLAAVGASYQAGPLSVYAVAENVFWGNEGVGQRDDTLTLNLAAQYKIDAVTLYAGYQYGDNVQKVGGTTLKDFNIDSNAYMLGAAVKVCGGTLKTAVGYVDGDGTSDAGVKTEAEALNFGIGFDYPLSKMTTLYTAATYLDRENTQDAKVTEETTYGFMAGILHMF